MAKKAWLKWHGSYQPEVEGILTKERIIELLYEHTVLTDKDCEALSSVIYPLSCAHRQDIMATLNKISEHPTTST